MALPVDLTSVVVTGTFEDATGAPLPGKVTFVPSTTLSDATGKVVIRPAPKSYWLASGSFQSDPLVATDNISIEPAGWTYTVLVEIVDALPYSFSCLLPSSPSPVDLSAVQPVIPQPAVISFIPTTGGAVTGTLTLGGSPPLQITAGAAPGAVLTSDGAGNVTWSPGPLSAKDSVQAATAAALPANTYTSGALTATANGALTIDGIVVAAGSRVLVQNEAAAANNGIYTVTAAGGAGTKYILTRAPDMSAAAEIPGAFAYAEQGTVNAGAGFIVQGAGPFTIGTTAINWVQFSGAGGITAGTGLGKSGNTLSLAVPVTPSSGGTGQTTLQAALNALAAGVAAGHYLRGDGTNVALSAIQASDVPTLNQSTTGNAATASIAGNVSGTVAIANGGTGVGTAPGALAALGALPLAGGTMTGAITLPANPAASLQAAPKQYVDAAQAAAIAASLPTLAQAAASASATLAVDTVTQVTAGTALTMTLPSPVAGALIVVEREAASTANVAVTGNVRGVGSTTVTLSLPSESEMFLGTASTWNPVAGHKTLGSLDTRYGQLATASSYTADQYFKSGRPWFDVVAFGADPTGVADSTVAIQTAINTALGLRTDTGVGMTGTTVTDAAAVSGDAGKYVNSPNYPLGCSLISSVTPGVGYVVATSATATLSGQAVGIGTGSAVGARIALGPVYLPRGTYKITADLIIRSAVGFAFRGAGAWATIISASGAGFTTAALLVDGSLDGVYEGIRFAGDGTEGTATSGSGGGIPDAMRLDWTTAAARSTSANTIRNIRVSSMKYVVGLSLEGNGTAQVDGTTLQDIVITGQQVAGSWSTSGNWQKGIALGNGSSGNNYDHVLYNCSAAACFYGVHCNASGFELFGSQPGANAVDFFLNPGAQISINGVQSQSGGQFIVGSGGSGLVQVSVRDVLFYTGNLVSSGKWITTSGGGASWLIENAYCYTAGLGGIGGAGVPLLYFNGNGAKETVTLVNVAQAAPPSTGITLTSGGSLIAISYVQMTSVTVPTVGTLFPLYCLNAGALYQQGTASARPAAAAFGEMFYWATDTSVLSHSSGSAWTTVTPAVSIAPDVQVFTSGGTWTKPTGPAPATTEVVLITPGGGGASGRRGAVSTVRCGGGGGAGGTVTRRIFSSADLPSTVTVTVPGQQSGGAAVTTDDTSGNAGASFAACSFGAFVTGFGGQGGQGGTATTGTGGVSAFGAPGTGGAGVSASTVGGAGVLANLALFTAPGGPSGGGITSGNVAGAGAAGASSTYGTVGTSAGGAVDSTAPTAGAGANAKGATGVSSGSGAASITTAAQQGADAAATAYGVGGAGGGASLNGNNSGAGGKGGGGYCVAISYFQ